MLRFSANLSLLFTEYAWPDRFLAAKASGFQAVEIQFPYALPVEIIEQALRETGLKLVLFNVGADDLLDGGEGLAAVPEKRQQFKDAVAESLAYAAILKPAYINVLSGRCLDAGRLAAYTGTFKDNLYYTAEAFASLQIKTVFEAINVYDMPGFIINSSQQMLAVLAELNHPWLGLQYDLYHMKMMGENCAEFLQTYYEKIGHIQFADCPGRGQPGTGEIDFKALFAMISALPYQGWVGAEYKPQGKTTASLEWLKNWTD